MEIDGGHADDELLSDLGRWSSPVRADAAPPPPGPSVQQERRVRPLLGERESGSAGQERYGAVHCAARACSGLMCAPGPRRR